MLVSDAKQTVDSLFGSAGLVGKLFRRTGGSSSSSSSSSSFQMTMSMSIGVGGAGSGGLKHPHSDADLAVMVDDDGYHSRKGHEVKKSRISKSMMVCCVLESVFRGEWWMCV